MKILVIVDRIDNLFGGMELYAKTLCNGLSIRHDVILYTNSIPDQIKVLYNKNIKIITPWSENCLDDIKGLDFDIVTANPFTGIDRGYQIAKSRNKPLFVTIHGHYSYGINQKEIADYAKKVIAVDDGIASRLRDANICVNKLEVVYNPIDTTQFYSAKPYPKLVSDLGLTKGHKTIVVVTRYDDGKEIPALQFAKVISPLTEKLNGLNVVFVGDGSKLETVKNAVTYNSKANVKFVGSQTNVRNYMNLGDIVLCSARTAMESVLCDKLTFQMGISKWGALVDKYNYIDTIFGTTYYTDYTDNELINHLNWFLTRPEEMREITKGLPEKVKELVDVNNVITKLEKIYQG